MKIKHQLLIGAGIALLCAAALFYPLPVDKQRGTTEARALDAAVELNLETNHFLLYISYTTNGFYFRSPPMGYLFDRHSVLPTNWVAHFRTNASIETHWQPHVTKTGELWRITFEPFAP